MFERLRAIAHEAMKFGVVGGIGLIIDIGLFNVLRYAGDPGMLADKPLTAKGISVAVATVFTYFGNRHWTWADRERNAVHREVILFFFFNAIGLLIAVGCLAVSHYLLDLRSPLADNVAANVIGLLAGMAFRFWSYRTFVFPATDLSEPGPPPQGADDLTSRL